MTDYQNILVAVDLSEESGAIIERARALADSSSTVHLVYVQEPMEAVYMGVVPYGPVFVGMDQVEDRLQAELKGKLESWAEQAGIDTANTHFLSGSPAREIHRFAEEQGVDLIVLGTHGQKGVQLLLGSTANSVLHGAGCDVLAVRMHGGD
ncbi:MAG: universal stress protein [Xanthomonadales bacterium]|jgi:universal stress protein A|nr:universal stress protein [Xanthomonadales bacterium]